MRITIEPTDTIVVVNGRQARHWRGVTDRGVDVDVFVAGVRLRSDADQFAFLAELEDNGPPAEADAIERALESKGPEAP